MSTAIAKRADDTEVQAASAPVSETAAIFSMIERVAADPSVSVERVEQLFGLYQRMQADRARRAYYAAFAEMQPKLPIIEKKGKGHNNSYAKWEDIVDGIRPVISEHGFSLSFRVMDEEKHVRVTCILAHRDGHFDETSYPFPYDKTGNKNDIQSVASAISYGKRYTACALLNIVGRDEDDDGHAAGKAAPKDVITKHQADELTAMAQRANIDAQIIREHFKVQDLADLTPAQFKTAVEKVKKKLELEGLA